MSEFFGTRPKASYRAAVALSTQDLVTGGPASNQHGLPWTIEPKVDGFDGAAWVLAKRGHIQELVLRHGAVLLRNFGISSAADFKNVVSVLSPDLLEYRERSSPRTSVLDRIYTSTEHPASEPIFLHNENSYQLSWPMRVYFMCETPAAEGGETPIADTRRVLQSIDPVTREEFRLKKILYRRTFRQGTGLSWQAAFGTASRSSVEQYCANRGITCQWTGEDDLHTSQVRAAVLTHPKTGEQVWFNHAAFFHISTLRQSLREALLSIAGPEDLPANSYYGDGSEIDADTMAHVRNAYQTHSSVFEWRHGDLLALDNMLVCHGRHPFRGDRRVLVAMAEEYSPTPNRAPSDTPE